LNIGGHLRVFLVLAFVLRDDESLNAGNLNRVQAKVRAKGGKKERMKALVLAGQGEP